MLRGGGAGTDTLTGAGAGRNGWPAARMSEPGARCRVENERIGLDREDRQDSRVRWMPGGIADLFASRTRGR